MTSFKLLAKKQTFTVSIQFASVWISITIYTLMNRVRNIYLFIYLALQTSNFTVCACVCVYGGDPGKPYVMRTYFSPHEENSK